MTTSTSSHSSLKAQAPVAGKPAGKAPPLSPEDRAFLQQIAQEIREAKHPAWKRRWKARYGLPPHPQFVRFVKREAPSLSPTELLRRLEREHRLEVRAQAALRPDFRHAQPDRYRVLLREIRECFREPVIPPTPTPRRATGRKRKRNPFPS